MWLTLCGEGKVKQVTTPHRTKMLYSIVFIYLDTSKYLSISFQYINFHFYRWSVVSTELQISINGVVHKRLEL